MLDPETPQEWLTGPQLMLVEGVNCQLQSSHTTDTFMEHSAACAPRQSSLLFPKALDSHAPVTTVTDLDA